MCSAWKFGSQSTNKTVFLLWFAFYASIKPILSNKVIRKLCGWEREGCCTVAWLYSGQVCSHFLCPWKMMKQTLSANSLQGMTRRSLWNFYFFPSCNMRWQLEFLARASPAASGNWGIISRFSVFIVRAQ